MLKTLLLTALIIAIALAFMLVKVLSRRGGSFSSQHIHDSKAMRERGIGCVMEQDRELRTPRTTAVDEHSRLKKSAV